MNWLKKLIEALFAPKQTPTRPTLTLTASSLSAPRGGTVVVSWAGDQTDYVVLRSGSQSRRVAARGSQSVVVTRDVEVHATAHGPGGTAAHSLTIRAVDIAPPVEPPPVEPPVIIVQPPGTRPGTPTVPPPPPPPVATSLSITTQPGGAVDDVAFTQQPVVQLLDQYGQNFSQSGVTITATKASGSGTLAGTTTADTDGSGVATFSNLEIQGTGDHTLSFAATGLTGATSNSFTVSAAGASLFTSSWAHSTGSSSSALRDGTKWTDLVSYNPSWGEVVAYNAAGVPTAGNAPTSGNVLRVAYNYAGNVDITNGWPALSNGESLYIGFRVCVAIRDAAGNLSLPPHHPIQPQAGTCAAMWSFKFGPRSNGTTEVGLATGNTSYPYAGWGRNPNLSKGTWYHIALRLTKQSTNTYKAAIRIDGVDDSVNWRRQDGSAGQNLAAENPDLDMTDSCLRNLFVGNNDPGWGGVDPTQDFIYWTSIDVKSDTWPTG